MWLERTGLDFQKQEIKDLEEGAKEIDNEYKTGSYSFPEKVLIENKQSIHPNIE